MDLKGEQIKDTYGNLLTIGDTAGTPTTGTVQNGDGSDVTDLTLEGTLTVDGIEVTTGSVEGVQGTLPTADDSSIDNTQAAFDKFKRLLQAGVDGGTFASSPIVDTYSLVYTTGGAYNGGVLAPNGDIYFVPRNAEVGQKVAPNGTVSTYSLVYTTSSAHVGGVLASNGDIYFVPFNAEVGQKVAPNGTVSTYSLVYTTTGAYYGGVLAPNGDIYFVPSSASVGQKVAPNGTVSTYSLVYTTSNAYIGGVLAPNGDIYFVPYNADRGQKLYSQYGYQFSQGVCMSSYLNKL